MGINGKSYHCDNCGKYIGEGKPSTNYTRDSDPPGNAYKYHKGGIMGFGGRIYYFCSSRCKKDFIANDK